MNITYLIIYLISIPITFAIMYSLSVIHYQGVSDRNITMSGFIYASKYKTKVSNCGIIALLPVTNVLFCISYFIILACHPKVAVVSILGLIVKRIFKTRHLLNRFSEEV